MAPAPLMIISTAGSGKSTVLVHRIASILRNDPNERVCGVSFTTESARHLRERTEDAAPECAERMLFGTFHSLAMRQLKAAGRNPAVANEGRQAELLSAAFAEVQADHPDMRFDAYLAFVEQTKRCIEPLLEPEHLNPYVRAYQRYQGLLARHGLMDYADLLIEAVRGMQSGQVAPLDCTSMLVDEAQDTDEAQYAFLMAHRRAGVKITIVGDDDQSIYGWRGAMSVDVFRRFREDTGAAQINLTTTFRCPRSIFLHAARLITRNRERMAKSLDSAVCSEGRVSVRRAASSKDEADMVVDAILRSGRPDDWGVLARTNEMLDPIETRLRINEIPYTRASSRSFWAHPPAALVLALCTDLVQGTVLGFEELLRRMGTPAETLNALHRRIRADRPRPLTRFAALADASSQDPVHIAGRCAKEWMRLLESPNPRSSDTVVHAMRALLRSRLVMGPGGTKRSRAMEDYELRMFDAATNAMLSASRKGARPGRTGLAALTERVRIASMDDGSRPKGRNGVQLMTLHASKGLEFPCTWLIGCEKDVLPHRSSPIEEERRLMFVGMTRASAELILSYSIEGERAPSPFLEEAGLH